MLLKTELNLVKYIYPLLCISTFGSITAHANVIDCQSTPNGLLKQLCHERFNEPRQRLNDLSLTTLLITDAPIKLIKDSETLWLNRLQQCKNYDCYQQQFETRIDQLNFFTSLNQTLTQHYLKFEQGKIAKHPIHLQIHQLSKDSLKIEAVAYRNPNNAANKQTLSFLAYSNLADKQQIHENENDCKYSFKYQKSILVISTEQKGCETFTGIYRLYD